MDGEALWNTVSNAPDPGLAESDLSAAQRDAMFRYKEAAMQDLVAQSAPKRDVSRAIALLLGWAHVFTVHFGFLCKTCR